MYNLLERVGVISTTELYKLYYHLRFNARNIFVKELLKFMRQIARSLNIVSPFKRDVTTRIRTKIFLTKPEALGIYVDRSEGFQSMKEKIMTLNKIQKVVTFMDSNHVYWGPFVDKGPDVVYIVKDFVDVKIWGMIPICKSVSYNHSYSAIVLFISKKSNEKAKFVKSTIKSITIYDIAPLTLWLFDAFFTYKFDLKKHKGLPRKKLRGRAD